MFHSRSKSAGNAHWYTPAMQLRMCIEAEQGIEAGKQFIRGVLNSSSPEQAYAYVQRKQKEWDDAHTEK